PWHRQAPVAMARKNRCRAGLRPPRMVGTRLERAVDPFLREPGRSTEVRVADLSPDRPSVDRAFHGDGPRRGPRSLAVRTNGRFALHGSRHCARVAHTAGRTWLFTRAIHVQLYVRIVALRPLVDRAVLHHEDDMRDRGDVVRGIA